MALAMALAMGSQTTALWLIESRTIVFIGLVEDVPLFNIECRFYRHSLSLRRSRFLVASLLEMTRLNLKLSFRPKGEILNASEFQWVRLLQFVIKKAA